MRVTARESVQQENLTQSSSLIPSIYCKPSHEGSWYKRILGQFQLLCHVLRQRAPLDAVGGKYVVPQDGRAIRHHKCSCHSRLDIAPDALVEIAIQRLIPTTEIWSIV